MNRRGLLAASSAGIVLGWNGCLDRIEAEEDFEPEKDFEPEYECDRFEGPFGRILIYSEDREETPVDVDGSEDLQLVDLNETGILSHEEIGGEMNAASRNRASVRDGELVGWLDLGNGALYDVVTESLSEFEPANTDGEFSVVRSNVQLLERWYVEYDEEAYRLTVQHSAFPQVGPPFSSLLEISPAASPSSPDDVIDAEGELIDENEFFLDVLEIARCSRERYDMVHPDTASNLKFNIGSGVGHLLTDLTDSSNEGLIEYGGEYYEFDLALAAE